MSDIAWSVLRITAGVYVGLCIVLFFMQKSQIYRPDRDVASTPIDVGMQFEDLRLSVPNGETVHAWHIPAKNETRSTVLFCHGNGGDIGDRIGSLEAFCHMGFNVMIFEYQGYGNSTGETTEKNTYDDAMAAWNYLIKEKGLQPKDISIFGRSLGGAVAIQLAEQVQPKLIAVESTFSSAPDMAVRMFPFLPARILCRYKYHSTDRIKNIHCPVIIAHGRDDNTIPYEFGKKIFDAAHDPKHFIDLGGGHNSGGIDIHKEFQDLFKKLATPKGDS